MCPPSLSSRGSWSTPPPAAPSSSKAAPEGRVKFEKSSSFQSSDHTRMHISESLPNTKHPLIDGHAVMIPADPVESLRFMRTQTLAWYCSIITGASNKRDQALTFGGVIFETVDKRRGTGDDPSVDKGGGHRTSRRPGSKADNYLPAQLVTDAGLPSTVVVSGRHVALQPPSLDPVPDTSDIWERRKYWQDKQGFIGDFEDPLDVRRKTQMSEKWAEGKYMDGAISFRGVFASTMMMEKKCENCEQAGAGSVCRVLVGGGKEDLDRFVGRMRKCARCVVRRRGCSLKGVE
ncbi:hypothetical protein P167DRAFT_576013 [Morchella conica CCBAS932]|uniref:Uncharacterized protein n=1 Tax=Morchella conica CCBAS932 TaxID=1392247 RepID=A0A3N4KY55_9PEZI|nr:hypothetical protein P167DRAFT_576013 [Morchella conica CCBAS932]